MKRLSSTILCDIQLQARNGFYTISLFIIALWSGLISILPHFDTQQILPILVFTNLIITTFYFISGLVLLEKNEGSIYAQIVTPLRLNEYLFSKLLTLSILACVENLAVVLLLQGFDVNFLSLITGVLLASMLFAVFGFIFIVRYDNINAFLMPSVAFMFLISLPVLPLLGIGQTWMFYVHPLNGPLLLIKGGFGSLRLWDIFYAVGTSLIWIGIFIKLSKKQFHQFLVIEKGAI
jgi:fluoroquinolone transport system permease protein